MSLCGLHSSQATEPASCHHHSFPSWIRTRQTPGAPVTPARVPGSPRLGPSRRPGVSGQPAPRATGWEFTWGLSASEISDVGRGRWGSFSPAPSLPSKTQQYDCKWYIPLTDLSFQTVDESEAAPTIPLVVDEELDAMKMKISQIKSDIQREKVGAGEALPLEWVTRLRFLGPAGHPCQAWSLPERGVGEGPGRLDGGRVPGGVRPLRMPPGRPQVAAGEAWVSQQVACSGRRGGGFLGGWPWVRGPLTEGGTAGQMSSSRLTHLPACCTGSPAGGATCGEASRGCA